MTSHQATPEQLVVQAKVQERQTLARELHDTVAHRVSTIAILAQAGQAVAHGGDTDGIVSALSTIKDEASRTLSEMRTIVGSLRDEDGVPAMASQHNVGDIPSLSQSTLRSDLAVDVEMTGDLDQLDHATGAALYRIAQESVTNAARHAPSATQVVIIVRGHEQAVEITVTNDGAPPRHNSRPGFGLIGMAERAERLNGAFTAGPNRKGWRVHATLPRSSELKAVSAA